MRRRFFTRCRELATRVPVDHPRTSEMRGFADAFARERKRQLADIDLASKSGGDGRALLESWMLQVCSSGVRPSTSAPRRS
jgi:hypothetical protein